jgi:hypothetical protein
MARGPCGKRRTEPPLGPPLWWCSWRLDGTTRRMGTISGWFFTVHASRGSLVLSSCKPGSGANCHWSACSEDIAYP